MRAVSGHADAPQQHKFYVENADGSKSIRTSTLLDFGAPIGSGGYSSMAKLVGIPCGISVQLVLDGKIAKPGILAPVRRRVCVMGLTLSQYNRHLADLIMGPLEEYGITMVEAEVAQ